ncbi:MAG TPA: tRNA epoxyqueuosine(34) reductase QueG [Planctomycetota bacterium]|nr:tRNA epoxyqueuosine(34) reductase QueG [Planctomycetota bacterium]
MGRDSSEAGDIVEDAASTSEVVRRVVLEAGFHRVGIAAAAPASAGPRLRQWIEKGFGGEMDYIERSVERRSDPGRVLEGARSVITAALHYGNARGGMDGRRPGAAEPRGVIAAYARGEDYHRILDARLADACRRLEERFGGRHRYYADTGPVLERHWAEEGGVGWIGKNTCAIDADEGSFFFLGAILTTLRLEPDSPAVNHCGSCRLCLDACPTGAFASAYELDARLCISYLTIEHRGPIPPALEPRLGNLIFGCDICQDVCPYNGPRSLEGDAALSPREENMEPSLLELASLDEEGFRRRFPRSAVRRAKLEGFLRNVIVALGNNGGLDAAIALERLQGKSGIASSPTLSATLERARTRASRRHPA